MRVVDEVLARDLGLEARDDGLGGPERVHGVHDDGIGGDGLLVDDGFLVDDGLLDGLLGRGRRDGR